MIVVVKKNLNFADARLNYLLMKTKKHPLGARPLTY